MTQITVTDQAPDAMAKTHLIRRGNRWHYNRAYPLDVQPITGAAPFRISLRTDSLAEAIRARPEAERRYWQAVDRARQCGGSGGSGGSISEPQALSIISEWFRQSVAGMEAMVSLSRTPEALEKALEDAQREAGDLRQELAEGASRQVRREAQALVSGSGYRDAGETVLRLLLRAKIAFAELYASRLAGDYGQRPADPTFAALLDAPAAAVPAVAPAAPRRTIAGLEAAYRADKADTWKPSTTAAYKPVFRVMAEGFGSDTPVDAITRDDGRRVFELVKSLPTGIGKRRALQGLSIAGAIQRGRALGLPTLNPKTINGSYMGLIASVFGWAVREGWMLSNPVAGLTARDTTPDEDKRDPFTPDQLAQIFGSPPWCPADRAPKRKPIRYWGPLIALFHGLRRGEIAQLRASDFAAADGCVTFAVRGSLKTPNARRKLSLHPELIRLGLPAVAADRMRTAAKSAKAGESADVWLFEGEDTDGRGKWGDALGDWFSREVVRKLDLKGTRLGLHSFRHNFEDRLREAGLHGTAIGAHLSGRAAPDRVAGAYGGGYSDAALTEAIGKVVYPGLNIGEPWAGSAKSGG